jgi:hypothetical protein
MVNDFGSKCLKAVNHNVQSLYNVTRINLYSPPLGFDSRTVLPVDIPTELPSPHALPFNTVKTCAMLFHSSQRKCVDKPNIMYNNTVIAYSPNMNSWVLLSMKTSNGMPILMYYVKA